MKEFMEPRTKGRSNFLFLGEAGSGKSEIAINFARYLAELGDKPVHFFDMDMTKPLFRSRDVVDRIEKLGITFHYEEQFYDAPTMVGGVNLLLKDDNCYVVMDVGGNDVGARAVGGYAPKINKENTVCYYVLNAFRPWSGNMEHIDGTLSAILGISHVQLGRIHMINNPNMGLTTTAEEALEGMRRMEEMIKPYMELDFACVKEDLYDQVRPMVSGKLMPIRLYLTYEWLKTDRFQV
ncbi:MAG: hypothetical protein HFI76_13945 [Lachnospiraceae bacterium]|jgi:hypothetical protein|nr:hypothetical protein [Lachnospiraceae bacterium]